MSPEQARGQAVNKRSDIWALGCVLYEILTGRSAFADETVSDTIAAILGREPDWTRLSADVPPSIHKVLRLCLNKDVKNRRQSAGDVRIDIEDAAAEPMTTMPATLTRNTRVAWVVAAAAALLAAVSAIPVVRHLRERPVPSARETRLQVNSMGSPGDFALSPDGRYITFVASAGGSSRLWLRALDKIDAQPLPGTDFAAYPFWSPDSRSIAFFASGKLYAMEIAAGRPQVVAEAPAGRGGTWGANGTILFAPANLGPLSGRRGIRRRAGGAHSG